jgi:ankyrin repeat protein
MVKKEKRGRLWWVAVASDERPADNFGAAKMALKEEAGDGDPAVDLQELMSLCADREAPIPVNVLKEKLTGANGRAILRAHGSRDETLLHDVCCNEHVTLDVVKFLVELYPEAVRHQSTDGIGSNSTPGWYPLGRACLNRKIPLEIVEYLSDLFPDPLMTSVSDLTPLAWIIYRMGYPERRPIGTLRIDLIRYIITKAPECVRVRVDNNSTVIHLACMLYSPSLELVQMLVQQWPDVLSIFNGTGELPLHALLNRLTRDSDECSTPIAVVRLLIDGFPAAVRTPSTGLFDTLPLHMACGHHEESLEVIQLLVEAYPEAVSSLAGYGRNYPLHRLLQSGGINSPKKLDVVRYLVEQLPDALQALNQDGALPLAYAVMHGLEIVQFIVGQYAEAAQDSRCFLNAAEGGKLEVIRFLHSLNPQAVVATDSENNTSLHRACQYRGNNVDRIEYLLSLNPIAIRLTSNNGDLPLHAACQSGMGEDVLRLLLLRNPDAIKVKNNDQCLPLHFAARSPGYGHIVGCTTQPSSRRSTVMSMLINSYPEAIRELDKEGRLPLHHAFKWGTIADIKLLVRLYPPSIRVVSRMHGLPVHEAAKAARHADAISMLQYLKEMAPESLDTHVTGIGLPLHVAAQSSTREVFEYLLVARYRSRDDVPFHALLRDRDLLDKGLIADRHLDEFPANVADRDSMGCAPLHIAVTTTLETSFIEKLIDHDPDAVQVRDKSNSVPLHYALRHGDPANAVGLLLDQYADAAKVADINDCLPLHVACRHGAPLDLVKHLVSMYEESVAAKDSNGELALHKACRGGHLALVEFLAEKNTASVRVPNSNGALPVFLLCQSSGKRKGLTLDENGAIGTIWQLLRKHPEAVLHPGSRGSNTDCSSSFALRTDCRRRKRIRLDSSGST